MIYDTFILYQELDLLEIRLNELNPVVDYFVLVESSKTFSGKSKPLFYEENKERYSAFASKIIHVVVHDMPDSAIRWDLENWQRSCIERGLSSCLDDDIVFLSDIDEIPSPNGIKEAAKLCANDVDAVGFNHAFYVNWFNRKLRHKWTGTVAVNLGKMKEKKWSLLSIRNLSCWMRADSMGEHTPATKYAMLEDGWHFSWMGGVEAIIKKIEAYSHDEIDTADNKDPAMITKRLNKSLDVTGRSHEPIEFIELEDTLPKYLLKNKEKFKSYIFEDF